MSRSSLGRAGEDAAVRFLEDAGLRVLARNFRSRRGEIDIVARDGETLVFVEVKSWSAFGFEELGRSIGSAKIGRLIETAQYFLSRNREYNGMAVRFDVVFIGPEGIKHLVSAFTERV